MTTSAHQDDAVGVAALAKAALRLLAERRQLPTPENYEQAWRRVSGDARCAEPDGQAGRCAAASAAPPWFIDGLLSQLVDLRLLRPTHASAVRQAIGSDWMLAGQRLNEALADRASMSWGPLIVQLQSGLAVPHQGWPPARKRDAVLRIVEAAGKRDDVLHSRLHALIEGWRGEPVVGSIADGPADAAGVLASATTDASAVPIASAVSAVGDEAAAARAAPDVRADAECRPRDERLIAEMSALLATLCDNLDGMTEQTSWMRGQVDVLRDSLRHPGDRRRLGEIRRSIADNADAQRRLQAARRDSIDEVKRMISAWIGSVGALSNSTGAFGDRIDAHVESISGVESVDELNDTVRALLEDTQAMSREIQMSHDEMAAMRSRALLLESKISRLEEELANASTQIITDHLTSTMNRRGLEQAFGGAQSRAAEFQAPLALAVLDVDDFKRVNDTLGHKGGDDALRQLVRIFKLKLRASDAVARFGGEEFVLLLPDLNVDDAVAHVVRLQREVTSHVFMSDEKRIFITFSAGVTLVAPSDTLTGAVERADQAMYAAKRAGKNCVRSI
ncbi:MAG: diguanylate cyclase [Burkholderiaceae bacterium]